MTLTELRIWHWERVVSHRKSQNKYEVLVMQNHRNKFYNERQVAAHKRNAAFHIECVQALNDLFETTVHQDMAGMKGKK
jgi:hypothetical protein